jgi:type III secretory pathway component EscT
MEVVEDIKCESRLRFLVAGWEEAMLEQLYVVGGSIWAFAVVYIPLAYSIRVNNLQLLCIRPIKVGFTIGILFPLLFYVLWTQGTSVS